jgi:hypothetical protein
MLWTIFCNCRACDGERGRAGYRRHCDTRGEGLLRESGNILMKREYSFQKAPRCSATSKRTRQRCKAPAVRGWSTGSGWSYTPADGCRRSSSLPASPADRRRSNVQPTIASFQRGADRRGPVVRQCRVPAFHDRDAANPLGCAHIGCGLQPRQIPASPVRCAAHVVIIGVLLTGGQTTTAV